MNYKIFLHLKGEESKLKILSKKNQKKNNLIANNNMKKN